jgi:hypothetical protein
VPARIKAVIRRQLGVHVPSRHHAFTLAPIRRQPAARVTSRWTSRESSNWKAALSRLLPRRCEPRVQRRRRSAGERAIDCCAAWRGWRVAMRPTCPRGNEDDAYSKRRTLILTPSPTSLTIMSILKSARPGKPAPGDFVSGCISRTCASRGSPLPSRWCAGMSEDFSRDYVNAPTLYNFHLSDAFVRGAMGPIGSGKSVACVMEIMRRAGLQRVGPTGKRRSRWAVIRNTYGELRDTTLGRDLSYHISRRRLVRLYRYLRGGRRDREDSVLHLLGDLPGLPAAGHRCRPTGVRSAALTSRHSVKPRQRQLCRDRTSGSIPADICLSAWSGTSE